MAPIKPRLHHASSSYYSMIARLSLVEAGIEFESHPVDIHRRRQQQLPEYVRINPNMTVPALELGERTLIDSREILVFALGEPEGEAAAWVERQYSFPIEELTFGWFLSWNPLARRMIPRTLASAAVHLRELAAAHPDLASLYERRAEVFEARSKTFDASHVDRLYEERLAEARAHLDALERALEDGRDTLVRSGYGPADVVWTVFLARMQFLRMGKELADRARVDRYAKAMFARPSFEKSDVWASIEPLKLLHQMFD